jgi:metal-sulfur cluster biosynthetic enzyme
MTAIRGSTRHDAILNRLREVPEPCSLLMRAPTNIVDMGLVQSVTETGGRIDVELVLTDPSCVHFAGMSAYITDTLKHVDGVEEVVVTPSVTTIWTPDRVSPPPDKRPTEGRTP